MPITFALVMKLCLVVGLWCNGVYINSRYDDDIFWPIAKLSRNWRIAKPLIHCINCMASLHSLMFVIVYFYWKGWYHYHYAQYYGFFLWMIVAVISSFTNGVIYLIHEVLEWCFIHIKNRNKDVG